jgi:hypothetical protein
MSEVGIHKYYCLSCKIHLFGESALRLALNTNAHNAVHHPLDAANWTGAGIIRSAHYSGPALPDLGDSWSNSQAITPVVRPEYTVPHGTTSKLTDADRAFLREAKVKWE